MVAKSDRERRTFARERGWRHLRLLSSGDNTYNLDYHAETPEGEQMPILNVFVRDRKGIRHSWATELMFAPRDEGEESRHVDLIWPNSLVRWPRPISDDTGASAGSSRACSSVRSRRWLTMTSLR